MIEPYYKDSAVTLFHARAEDILPEMEIDSVRLLWTDPPYGHGNLDGDLAESLIGGVGQRKIAAVPIANDSMSEMRSTVDRVLSLCVPLLKKDSCCCCCCCCGGGGGPTPTFAWVANRLDEKGLQFFHAVVWDKSKHGWNLGWRFRRNYEFVMVAHKKNGKLAWVDPDTAVPNIVSVMPLHNRVHPNEKPIELVEWSIRLHTVASELVLDPFAGSGTTLLAAKRLGRRATGIEMEEKFCEEAVKKLRNMQEVLFEQPQEPEAELFE